MDIAQGGGWELDESMEESAVRECLKKWGCWELCFPPLSEIQYETHKAKKRRLLAELEQQEQRVKQDSAKQPKASLSNSDSNSSAIVSKETMSRIREHEVPTPKSTEETSSVASVASAKVQSGQNDALSTLRLDSGRCMA